MFSSGIQSTEQPDTPSLQAYSRIWLKSSQPQTGNTIYYQQSQALPQYLGVSVLSLHGEPAAVLITVPSEIIYLEVTGREMRKQLFWDFDETDEHS